LCLPTSLLLNQIRTIRFDRFKIRVREKRWGQKALPKPFPTCPLETPLYKITLLRSPRGLHPKYGKIVKALGLRRGQSVYRPHEAKYAGSILKIKELVAVENTTELGRVNELLEQKSKKERAKGYTVLGRIGEVTL